MVSQIPSRHAVPYMSQEAAVDTDRSVVLGSPGVSLPRHVRRFFSSNDFGIDLPIKRQLEPRLGASKS